MNAWPRRSMLALLVAVFAVVQSAYIASGVRFVAGPLDWMEQFLDPRLLRDRLWESLFYLPSQPPLFNLFLGLVLKAGPADYGPVFWGIYLAAGLSLYVATFALLRKVGVPRA